MTTSTYTIIDNPSTLSVFLDGLVSLPTNPPSLYLDLEGVKLSRSGTISIIQVHVRPAQHTFLIDVTTLGPAAFSTPSASNASLTFASILSSPTIPKVLFDLRNDNDALFNLYNVSLSTAHDLQLMENATRMGSRKAVSGLAKAIEYDAGLSYTALWAWKAKKDAGQKLLMTNLGGDSTLFDRRPMPAEVVEYCVADVEILPKLWDVYEKRVQKMSAQWKQKIAMETEKRINAAMRELPDARTAVPRWLGPWGQ